METFAQNRNWRAADDFIAQAKAHPERPALTVAGDTLSYGALLARAQKIAAQIAQAAPQARAVAIYGSRQADTYAAILAILMRGAAYVPLNPKFPPARNQYIVKRAEAAVVLHTPHDTQAVAHIASEKGPMPPVLNIATAAAMNDLPVPVDQPYAYILFTSGSTGQPKGVALRHANLGAYLDATFAVTDYGPRDRMSQNFDLTFDLSVHDMFVCWRAGAHLIVPSEADLERPGPYIRNHGITCWFSVPSLAQKIRMQQDLTPGYLGGLRLSLFCGEALPVDLARDWAAATRQRVENWYGPTEATISATRYVLPADTDQIAGRNNLVPIGMALPGMETAVDATGELLLIGPQVADGYLGDPEKTAAAFVRHQGRAAYRTGDRVEMGSDGMIHFTGRLDTQIKIRGYRVELGEIEATLRELSGGCAAVVVPLPLNAPAPTSLVGVVEGFKGPGKTIRDAIKSALPDYMTPARVLVMPAFPKNASGKVDRGAIGARVLARLEKMNANAQPKKMKRYDRLIAFAQEINPALSRERLEGAINFMDAGLDSMGFVEFSLRLEKQWNLELTQESVAALSQMSLWQMVHFLRRSLEGDGPEKFAPDKNSKGGELKRTLHYRAMRALDFLDQWPNWLAGQKAPVVPFLGSSGFMRAIDTDVIAQAAGGRVQPANIAMAMLSVEGIAEFCEHVAQTARAASIRYPLAVLEMEIMQLSIMPPAGDIEILADYKAGHFADIPRKHYDADTLWDAQTGGTIAAQGGIPTKLSPEANWEKKRNQEIRAAFSGEIPMDAPSVAAWRRGLEALIAISDRVAVVVHPIQGLAQGAHGPHIDILMRQALPLGVQFIHDTAFCLDDADFKNISHVNDTSGRAKFSAQLGALLFPVGT